MFDDKQESYLSFRDIISERTKRVVVWAGAGLSKPAKLPSWPELRDGLCDSLEEKAAKAEEGYEKQRLRASSEANRKSDNYWVAFQRLRDALGQTTYQARIRELFYNAGGCLVPSNYKLLWKLPLDGILNLNIDRLATRAHSEVLQGKAVHEFSGKEAGNFVHVLKGATPFIANLHGRIADADSWVFTHDEVDSLLRNQGYLQFINSCLCARTIIHNIPRPVRQIRSNPRTY